MTDVFYSPAATGFGANHGYCFDGDFVSLTADVNLGEQELAGGGSWWLQLWASVDGFECGLSGVKVAELALDAVPGAWSVAGRVSALPPAGTAPQVMGVALVSLGPDGGSRLRDLSVFPSRQSFVQPRLQGEVRCEIVDGTAEIAVAAIQNPRAADTASGTLALEIWALDAPYGGGSWSGSRVAGVELGVLAGGASWPDARFSASAVTPVAGQYLAVMLREWTAAGYVTRDFRNLPVSAVVAATAAPALPAALAPVVVAAAVAPPVVGEEQRNAGKDVTRAAGKKPRAGAKAGAATAGTGPVAVNTASEADIAAVKGIGARLAHAIIAARPFASLEDLCRAKYMGPRLLKRVRAMLRI